MNLSRSVEDATADPLSGPPPPDVPLRDPPIVRVIAQVRYPTISAIRDPDEIADFRERICAAYPSRHEDRTKRVVENPGSDLHVREEVVWRFQDQDLKWRASLAPDFLALEAAGYAGRKDFFGRLRMLLDALQVTVKPQEAVRLGVRYIDRIASPAADDMSKMIRQEVLGVSLSQIGSATQHVLTQSLLRAEEGSIQAKWGHLPPGCTSDPDALEPLQERSWILDLDMFSGEPQKFVAEELSQSAERFADRIYSLFRWMVTDEFLRFYGGEI